MMSTEKNAGKSGRSEQNPEPIKTAADIEAEPLQATAEVLPATTDSEPAPETLEVAPQAPQNDLSALTQEQLINQLLAAQEQLDELGEMKDGFLRAKAEMENIRRRSQNEIISARKFAIESFAQELLTVKDSLDHAALVELGDAESTAVVTMKEGLQLTLKQLETAFGKFSVEQVEAIPGGKFNPEQHQAISMAPSEEVESNHIIEVMQKGFLLRDRLLRPAMVVVAS